MKRILIVIVCAVSVLAVTPSPLATAGVPPVVDVDDVRQLTGRPEFVMTPSFDVDRPTSLPDVPLPCRPLLDPATVFATGPTQFRAVTYDADFYEYPAGVPLRGMAMVTQTVATYADPVSARTTFDRIVAAVPGCAAANEELYEYVATQPDPSDLLLTQDGSSYGYRVSGASLFEVYAMGTTDDRHVVMALLDGLDDAQG